MAIAKASAQWNGTLKEGSGSMKGANGFFDAPFTFLSRFEGDKKGTNPEELIGAAHAGCFSMALSAGLGKGGFTPTRIHTTATVHLEKVVPFLLESTLSNTARSSKSPHRSRPMWSPTSGW